MLKRLLPFETSFFEFFEKHSRLSIETCKELALIAQTPSDLPLRVRRIKELEHQADDVARECIAALHRTFITPIDRADIHRLIKRLDDIVDAIDALASRMVLYDIRLVWPEMQLLTTILVNATSELHGALCGLRNMNGDLERIQSHCASVYECEKEADEVLRTALARLFNEEKDPVTVIKWKEIFERLERATDHCETVANIIEGVVIEAS
ncbi:MAG: DUF47 family protein [Candidatus Zixiibacteriota bacterium]